MKNSLIFSEGGNSNLPHETSGVPARESLRMLPKSLPTAASDIEGRNLLSTLNPAQTSSPSSILSELSSQKPSTINSIQPPVPFSTPSEIPSQRPTTIYGLSKISLTTLFMRLYSSTPNSDITQNSMHKLVILTSEYINEYIKKQLQSVSLESLEEMILQVVFVQIKIDFSSQNSTICTESFSSNCDSILLSSEAELLGLDSFNNSQLEKYRFLLMDYLSQSLYNASVDVEEAPKHTFLNMLQNSDDQYLMHTTAVNVTVLDVGYNPFETQYDSYQIDSWIDEKKFSDMIETPMWLYFFCTLFVLVGAVYHVIRSYWKAKQTSLLKIHVESTMCALGNNVQLEESKIK